MFVHICSLLANVTTAVKFLGIYYQMVLKCILNL
jgi:hypothetical protein